MLFEPIDENSLRHLFTHYSSELKMSYLGPYLNASNKKEESPDCLIADFRRGFTEIKKCEFKFIPSGSLDFKHNNLFDIAIVWDLYCDRIDLREKLFKQNGCTELIILKRDYGFFSHLQEYNNKTIYELSDLIEKRLIKKLEKKSISSLYSLYLAVEAFPNAINIKKTENILIQKFPSVRDKKGSALTNIAVAFAQRSSKLMEVVEGGIYRYNNEFPKILIKKIILEKIRKSKMEPPSEEMVQDVICYDY